MLRRFARLQARVVRYLESGEGKPLIFLHAFPLSAEQWLPQLARVPAGWRFVAPDFRGFGGVPPEPSVDGQISMDTYAADILELMAHLEISSAVLCGLSMGGYVAMAVARKAPQRLTGLVLADTRATADNEDARGARDRMLSLLSEQGPAAVALDLLPKLLGPTSTRRQPDLVDVVRHAIVSTHPDGIAAAVRAMKARPDATAMLRQVECPVLVIVGEDDLMTPPREAETLHGLFTRSTLVTLPAAGHLSNLEAPTEFNNVLAGWLATLPAK
jgi:pimeloyl-ACP methyl ester carboxylesterase